MIVVNGAANDRLSVFVSPDESSDVKNILNSLLGVKLNPKSGLYYLPVHDFPIFKEKLDRIGAKSGREMDEKAWELIRNYSYRLQLNEEIKAGALDHEISGILIGGYLKSTPWPDQVADIRFCLRSQRAGIFNEMGTGKTLGLLASFALLKTAGLAKYALVVAPNTVKQNWLRQTLQHTTLTASELGNGKGQLMRRLKQYSEGRTDICVTHYEALRDPVFQEALVKLPFDMAICDEAHLMKNAPSKRSRALLDTLAKLRPAMDLVEAEVELADGTVTKAVLPVGVKPGDVTDFW